MARLGNFPNASRYSQAEFTIRATRLLKSNDIFQLARSLQ